MSSPDRITAAVLWDESHLWGLIALRALKQKGLSFNLLSAADIRGGALEGHKLLFIPGGWASNKSKALGVAGAEAIRSFVRSGGNYFGICGGAGLATRDGIGLLAAERVATQLRVPSFSGPITCHVDEHPIWSGIYKPTFWAWWPSQLQISDPEIQILARYDAALPEAFSSDIRVGSVFSDAAWAELEADYGINLNPARLTGEPAVIEGMFGSGRVVLSMLHFDTPDDARGNRVLRQAWTNLGGSTLKSPTVSVGQRCFAEACSYMLDEIRQLIDFGEQKGLWHWRTPWVLQWRRGVRGFEYCALAAMNAALADRIGERYGDDIPESLSLALAAAAEQIRAFSRDAKNLLALESQELLKGRLTYDMSKDPVVQELRSVLFGTAKSYGGRFKEIVSAIDAMLFPLLP